MVTGHKEGNKFHPHNSGKGGVSEKDLNMQQNGRNDVIVLKSGEKIPMPKLKSLDEKMKEGIQKLYTENKNEEFSDEIIKYVKWGNEYYGGLEGIPVSLAEKMIGKKNLVDPLDTQNNSPSAKEMIAIVKKYGGTLEGYWIPPSAGRLQNRDDIRISFDGFTIKGSEKEMQKLKDELHPDEFSKTNNGYRFWWD